MSLLDEFSKISNKDPLRRIADVATADVQAKIQNSVTDLFSNGLKKAGFSSPTGNSLAARFADSFKQGVLDQYFRQLSSSVERVLEEEIFDNIFPSYKAETVASIRDRQEGLSKKIAPAGMKNGSSLLQFPSSLGKYYMALKFRSYTRTAPQAPAKLVFNNSILLPVPKNLSERFDLKIHTDQTNAYGLIMDLVQTEASKGKDADIDLSRTFSEQGWAAGYMVGAQLLEQRSPIVSGLLGQYVGAVPNPHLATFFQGIEMRSYGFEWLFAPRNKEESKTLQDIIKQLKVNSLPTFSKRGQAAFTYPDLCFIEMYPWANNKEEELIKFKPALLRNVQVDYAPAGPSFFAGTNLPTLIKLGLEFTETEYFTGEDYGAERRSDGIENIGKIAEGFLGTVSPELNAQLQSTLSSFTEGATSTDTTIIEGQQNFKAAKETVDLLQPGTPASEETRIATISIDGVATEVRVGRAGQNGMDPIPDVESESGLFTTDDGRYYITYNKEGGTGQFVSGPYETAADVLNSLSKGDAPAIATE